MQPKLNVQEPEHEHSAERNSTFGSLGKLSETERVKVKVLGGLLKIFRNAYRKIPKIRPSMYKPRQIYIYIYIYICLDLIKGTSRNF